MAESLSQVLSRGALPVGRALDIVAQVAGVLALAHAAGIIHRNLTSANIFLMQREGRDDFAKVTGWYLSGADGDPRVVPSDQFAGDAHYASPEQAAGSVIGPASDLYSLGIIFYELLTGERPFRGRDAVVVLEMQRIASPRPVEELRAGIDPRVVDLCSRLIQKEPSARYTDAFSLAEALRELMAIGPRPNN